MKRPYDLASESNRKQPQYSLYALMEACARDPGFTGMKVGFPGEEKFDLCFEGRGSVEAGKARRVTLD